MSCHKCHKCHTCDQFAEILGGTVIASSDGLCVVQRIRDIDVKILGRPTHSPLALAALFSYEDKDSGGETLNLGETVIFQEEINPFITILRGEDIKITALHNHWLFEKPRLMYINFESIDKPLPFARKVAAAFNVLRDK